MLRIAAPAKINLTLHVTGRRADGYHTLDSLVAFADVFDHVSVDHAETLSLEVVGPNAAALSATHAQENIVLRAARVLASAIGTEKGAHVVLHKVLPVAAGIGGGSADAAAVLLALSRLWHSDLPQESLLALAAAIGADVPVCLQGRATQIGGVGEQFVDVPSLPPSWLVLANPGVALSTPEVFRMRTGAFSEPAPLDVAPPDAAALASELAKRRNDLTAAAISLVPGIGVALSALAALPGALLSRMSGSGATCYALFASEGEAQAAARILRADHRGWWIVAAPLLSEFDAFALGGKPNLQR